MQMTFTVICSNIFYRAVLLNLEFFKISRFVTIYGPVLSFPRTEKYPDD